MREPHSNCRQFCNKLLRNWGDSVSRISEPKSLTYPTAKPQPLKPRAT